MSLAQPDAAGGGWKLHITPRPTDDGPAAAVTVQARELERSWKVSLGERPAGVTGPSWAPSPRVLPSSPPSSALGLRPKIESVSRARPTVVAAGDIVRELKAAVGDRVLVMPVAAAAPSAAPAPAAAADPPGLPTFEPLAIGPAATKEERQAALFDWIDRDGDGVLSRAEYAQHLLVLGQGEQGEKDWA
eukprot:SAG22_NODE_8140_length_680_cov_0.716007_1_plen_188_part_01